MKLVPDDAEVFDLDLFDTPVELIEQIHEQGKKVICYFSAGGSESWRTDYKLIQTKDKGERMRKWPKEQWLNIRSPDVWEVMRKRIELARTKGCDGIDADNTGEYPDLEFSQSATSETNTLQMYSMMTVDVAVALLHHSPKTIL